MQIAPACGILKTEDAMEVLVRHTESHTLGDLVEGIPQNWWSEDTRDKEVVLTVQVQGTSSLETRTHQICVRHCYSTNTTPMESRTNSSRRVSSGSQRRSEGHWHNDQSDLVSRG